MPEGDTLVRTAAGLRPFLLGRTVTAASARAPGPQAGRLVGATVTAVEAAGKNLLIRFDNGLEVRTHLRMHGSWHRYRPGERWRRPPARARLVIEVPGSVAVCFDAPVVELFEVRAEALHPSLWQARVSPWTPVRDLDLGAVAGLIDLARDVLRRGAESGRRPRHVYRRAARPCPRCRTVLSVAHQGTDLPRLTFRCPACQPDRRSTP